jgi:DNA-binding helix-hairpin-helix protein with protein kinase domain
MVDLKPGHVIQTRDFKKVVILPANQSPNGKCPIGEGGQGAVYTVDYDGKKKALKWYSGKKFANPKKFYENLENNVKKGKPTNAFLWPEAITEKQDLAFGYIMDLRPKEYEEFSRFLIGRVVFASITAMTNCAIQITAGFRALHQKGYSYQDLNDGNFFINPQNGSVLICDNDNVSEYGKNSGIAGKARYMAPEVVAKGVNPGMQTDLFSLAVILFMLWTNNHPLEGKAACVPCMDAENEKKIYGKNPVFVWDPTDTSNRPVQGIHKGAIIRWPFLPVYLQDLFIKAFSKELMHDPQQRIIEREWQQTFIRMRSEIFMCPTCNVKEAMYFTDPVTPSACPKCGRKNLFPMYIKTQRYNVAVHQRTKLYACHTVKSSDDFETLTGEVSVKDGEYELKNLSGENWTLDDGKTIAPNGSFVLKKGAKIDFGLVSAELI